MRKLGRSKLATLSFVILLSFELISSQVLIFNEVAVKSSRELIRSLSPSVNRLSFLYVQRSTCERFGARANYVILYTTTFGFDVRPLFHFYILALVLSVSFSVHFDTALALPKSFFCNFGPTTLHLPTWHTYMSERGRARKREREQLTVFFVSFSATQRGWRGLRPISKHFTTNCEAL